MRAYASTFFALLTSGLVACGSGFLLGRSDGPYTASFGQALDCSGSPSARVEFQQNIVWAQSAYTIEAWIRPNTWPSTARPIFSATVSVGVTFGLALNTNGTLQMTYPYLPGCVNSTVLTAVNALSVLGRNYHVVGRVSDNALASLKVDGVEVTSIATTAGALMSCASFSPGTMYIGNNATIAEAFPGIIDDVRLTLGSSARYPLGNYPMPTMPHPFDSATTQWLMRLDEGTVAGTVFTANPPVSIQAYTGVMVESPFP